MKHTHVIEAQSAKEFKAQISDLFHEFCVGTPTVTAAEQIAAVTTPNTALDKAHAAVDTTAKKSKKKEEKAEPVAAAPVVETAAPAVSPAETSADDIFGSTQPAAPVAVPYTMEDCQKRLQAVVNKHDITKAKALLAQFNVPKLVDLKPDQFNKFIFAADELT